MMSYCVLLSVRNEQLLLDNCLRNIQSQIYKPRFIVIIDDGSTDRTKDIIIRWMKEYNHIHGIFLNNERIKIQGANLSMALNSGLEYIRKYSDSIDYVLKLDADAILPSNYMGFIMKMMEFNLDLGVCGGITQYDWKLNKHISDSAKVYRYECLDLIGIPVITAFDTYMLLKARQLGYAVKKFNISYNEIRPFERRTLRRWFFSGRARYLMCYPLIPQLLISVAYTRFKPYLLGSMVMFISYILHHLNKWRVYDEGFYEYIKNYLNYEMIKALNKILKRKYDPVPDPIPVFR